ncbi:MAG: hypothetical protein AAFR27_12800, partial [Pseudomonadota bacterium]
MTELAPFSPRLLKDRRPPGFASLDFETRSAVDLTKTGVGPYCAHASTEMLCFAYQLPDRQYPETCFSGGDGHAQPLFDFVRAGGVVSAWNAPFEFAVWGMLHLRYPDVWPELP